MYKKGNKAADAFTLVKLDCWEDMAYNVFGNPITNSTLEGMPEYASKAIRRIDRAHVALNMKNAEKKDVNAREYVENLKRRWGVGVSTLCLVYNATGDTVTFVTSYDWWGHIGPAPFPQQIANGQWGAFLHVKTSGTATGSTAAVVNRGKNDAGDYFDWMLSWSNPWNRNAWDNTAYTDIRGAKQFVGIWDTVKAQLFNSGLHHSVTWKGCSSTVTTGSFTSPIFEGIMTLENA
ncbi:hypothetical protein F0562_029457 [Nyssa sinensis]|uniref:23 kDa jasmonate-induced protein-like n=1 Tax=Nyssa sinensis TaxID=561372 RepID=A0A5J5B2T1_9ASTE|nr:hypothetical protein F0562_029457 [Nyssa sinensis]